MTSRQPQDEFHVTSAEEVVTALATQPAGLTQEEAASRFEKFGPNKLPEPPRRSAFHRLFSQLHNALIYVLIGAALITAALGHWIDTGVILAVVIVNAAIGFIQEGRAEQAMEAIRQLRSLGALDAVPETTEASLQLSESVLFGLGVPDDVARSIVDQEREDLCFESVAPRKVSKASI